MQIQIKDNIEYANRFRGMLSASSCVCIITNVNEKDATVDVTVPSMGSKLFGVQVATGIGEGSTSLKMLPSKNEKGIVLLSSQHAPMLIAVIPSKKQSRDSYILKNETIVGTSQSFLKTGNDNSVLLKTPATTVNLSENKLSTYSKQTSMNNDGCTVEFLTNNITGNSFSRETYFYEDSRYIPIKKENILINDIINKDMEDRVLLENEQLLSTMTRLGDILESFNSNVELGSSETVSSLLKLREDIVSDFIGESECTLIVEKGESYYNNDKGLFLSVRLEDKEGQTLLFSIEKNK